MYTNSRGESGQRPRILVIEDEQGLLDILTINLQSSGYEVIGAADGMEGLRLFEEGRPDLVVLDVNLPKLSGFRLLELFRAREYGHVPVLALTALDFAEAEDLVDHGLDAIISKPFETDNLMTTIRHLLTQAGWSSDDHEGVEKEDDSAG